MHLPGRKKSLRLASFLACLMVTGECLSESAEVLPQGVFRADLSYKHYLPEDERYDPDGDIEKIATDYNTSLDSGVFPDLGAVEAAFMMPAGSASLGDSVVDFEYHQDVIEFSMFYGVTDKLSVGFKVPYSRYKNKVDARLKSGPSSSATVGKNPDFGTPSDPFPPFEAPIIPLAAGGVPFSTDDVLDILSNGLVVNGILIPGSGFGFDRFGDWEDEGFGDIEAGARYQYFNSDVWRLAVTGGVTLPTGDVDDPDNLIDLGFGTGAYGLFFALNNDYLRIDDWIFNATLRFDVRLPEEEELRIPEDVNAPVTANREKVDRDLGDSVEIDLMASYAPTDATSVFVNYIYTKTWKDEIDGSLGLPYNAAEKETNWEQQRLILGFSYSSLPKYMETRKGIPFKVGINYRNRVAGTNNAFDSEYLETALTVYF